MNCYDCKLEKPASEFSLKKGNRKHSQCKECKRKYNKIWYKDNKKSHIVNVRKNNKEHIKKLHKEINELKEKTPCKDCGKFFPAVAMDFDHVEGDKEDNISSMIQRKVPKLKILNEILKCEIVCAVCHRLRTYKRLRSSAEPEQTASIRKVGGSNPSGGTNIS